MSASATPKQGDHVFNALDTAILRPYETIASLRSDLVSGQQFVHDYLLHSYSLARQIAHNPVFRDSRRYAATAGNEETTIRELTRLRSRYPVLGRITRDFLQETHTRNSRAFGSAAAQFEFEVLFAIQQALERAVTNAAPPVPPRATRGPGLAFQHMINTAYDPAAALAVITSSMASEQAGIQQNFHPVIVRLAETLDRPGMWGEPFAGFSEHRSTETGEAIASIGIALLRMDSLKGQSSLIQMWISEEIGRRNRSAATESVYASMIHLLHARLQQTAHLFS